MNLQYFKISGQGKRNYNEDAFLIDADNNLFMVCDGVGGSNRGDIASKKACEYFSRYLLEKGEFTQSEIEKSLLETERCFDEYMTQNPDARGMATTLTFLKLENEKATIGHIGDSRVYQIRNGKILFMTRDHSFVNELVASGFLTEEEARQHPKRNQITRAIQGSENSTLIDVDLITSIEPGDYFLLCSDGILEGIDNEWIENNFTFDNSLEKIENGISESCQKNSSDNYTAIVIKITDI